jgi:gliding motility-associated-like protein
MRKFLFVWILLLSSISLFATHNRAGEITFKHVSNLTYEFTVVTYTYSLSPADRPTLDINWGDNTSSTLARVQKTPLPNYINLNIYKGTHTFSGQGSFKVSVEDPNRNGGVINIPNSINVPFYIETILNISPFIGPDNSPILLNPPIDNGCIGFPFYHNAGAYDVDGDSLAYELVACRGENGNFIQGFTYPAASQSFSIDPVTGTISWINPLIQGEYNVAFLIKEYRNGFLIGTITRDMQITIGSCNNTPPVIQQLSDTCVTVGDNLSFVVKATDIDNDIITLRATGGPIVLANNPANFPQPTTGTGFVQSTFSWTPDCDQVQLQPYQVVFKAKDDGSPINLVDIKTSFIKVVAPSPKNLIATPQANQINLIWDAEECSNNSGYDIYRHNGYIGYLPNNCETGVPAWTGYVKIGSTTSDTTFVDDNNGYGLIHGPSYCYMVVATFPDGAESYPSLEACASLIKDVPVITNVSVDTTSSTVGKNTIIWSMPTDLDTVQTPGPFKYLIYNNTIGINQPMNLIDSLTGLTDTIYHLNDINTDDNTHYYKIELVNNTPGNRFVVGETQIASSVYVSAQGHSNRVELKWNEMVPWANYEYVVYKQNSSGIFDSIGVTTTQNFTDSGLVNGADYCYKIKSIGEYTASGFTKPLVNWSQEVCASPIDDEAPCAPNLSVSTDCQIIENILTWNNPNNSCANDVVSYNLYYTPSLLDDYSIIYSPSNPNDTSYIHNNITSVVGCYYVTAIDSFNNESAASNLACVDLDSCRLYHLPNVFTPNGDGYNDKFIPFPYDFVKEVRMTILNRWGAVVFKTEDPDILWDGKDINSKQDCSEGVYFYICDVYEYRLEGLKIRTLNGSVSLYR